VQPVTELALSSNNPTGNAVDVGRPSHEAYSLLQSKLGLEHNGDVVGDTDQELHQTTYNTRLAALTSSSPVGFMEEHESAEPAPVAAWEYWAKTIYALALITVTFAGMSGMYAILKHVIKTAFSGIHVVEADKATTDKVEHMAWAHEYQPWTLVFRGLCLAGKQAFVLCFVFYQTCMWNPNKLKIIMHCNSAHLGKLSYFCEGTKAFARALPLLGATFSMIITARFIVQQRLYYLLLKKGVLIDYANYTFIADGAVLTVVVCFCIGLLHWLEGLSYISVEKLMYVLTSYLVPVGVFFVLLESVFDIERHLVPLAKFYEEDPEWARKQLAKSVMVSEKAVRHCARVAQREMRGVHPEGFSMDSLLENLGEKVQAVYDAGESSEDELAGQTITNALFKGLWPTSFVLDRRLNDTKSSRFRQATVCFYIIFCLIQAAIMLTLVASAWQEFTEALPSSKPWGAKLFGDQYYNVFGDGYCRGPSRERPPGIYRALTKVNRRQCGEQCSRLDNCLGFSTDLDLCHLYLPREPKFVLPGWTLMESAAKHPITAIVATNEAKEVVCFARISHYAETEDLTGSFVYFFHLLVVSWVLRQAATVAFGRKPIVRPLLGWLLGLGFDEHSFYHASSGFPSPAAGSGMSSTIPDHINHIGGFRKTSSAASHASEHAAD